ncbi:MarR family winged helix-turn-helix transcriptional regulator [Halodurantibacterium flavum]|uniref:MarR family winged helix-turn-helix transcriptional regulator n=1 Tax=Halodurantibacterium flavum TaxID=1382802 RepID=A0ABW4RZC9_9RHOB
MAHIPEPDVEPLRLGSAAIDGQVSYKLRLAQIVAYRAFEGVVTGFGVAPRYLGLLWLIRDNPGQAQSRLAEAVALQRSSLVTILDRLEADGLVERRAVSGDRRMKQVWLTGEGKRTLDALIPLAEAHEAAMTAGLNEEERAVFLRALDQVVRNLS